MELVSPAGNLEKLKYAYLFGADAAYIGIKNFSLRTRADNLESDQSDIIKKIKGTKKLYGALNIFFHDSDIRNLEKEIDYISGYPFDALIISDIGILNIIRKRLPDMELHLSTQANCTNAEAAKLYRDLGFSRIIPARELSLKEIENIKNKVNIEIEVFVHGAICLAYSGRCFLSRYMTGRSANKGDCAHSCRWYYKILEEEKRPGEYFPIIEGENFTTVLSSKDLCLIDHLDKLKNSGIDSLKIEGRMKSIYYTAITARAYRKALDNLDGEDIPDLEKYKEELYKVSHREFSTGFFFDNEDIQHPNMESYFRKFMFLGIIENKVAFNTYSLTVKNQIRTGEEIEYIGYDILYMKDSSFRLLDENKKQIPKTDHGKTAYIVTDKPVKPGYIIRQANPFSEA
jgi:U32 family peptidase